MPNARLMKTLVLALIGNLCTAPLAFAGDANADPDTQISNQDDRATGSVAQRLVQNKGYPAAFEVCATTSEISANVAGVSRIGGEPVRPTDRFPIGSMTKSMTATLAALLVQDQVIDWDTKLLDAMPELAATARPEYAEVTLRDLLAHRGGIVTPESLEELPPISGTLREQRAQYSSWALMQTPTTPPGTQADYSNGGYVVAAALLERLAGEDYESLMRSRLFDPLGMDAEFGAPGSAGGTEPWGHRRVGRHWQPLAPAESAAQVPEALNPAGLLKIAPLGLGRYLQLHLRALRGEAGLLLTPEAAMTLHREVQDGFALGWLVANSPSLGPISLHNGSDDASYYALMGLSAPADGACAVGITGMRRSTDNDAERALLNLAR